MKPEVDRLTVYIPKQEKRQLLSHLHLEGKNASEFFRTIITDYLDKLTKAPKKKRKTC